MNTIGAIEGVHHESSLPTTLFIRRDGVISIIGSTPDCISATLRSVRHVRPPPPDKTFILTVQARVQLSVSPLSYTHVIRERRGGG